MLLRINQQQWRLGSFQKETVHLLHYELREYNFA